MTRRSAVIALHWTSAFLLLAMIKGGSAAPALRWTFVLVVALWAGMAVLRGLAGRPGPRLAGGMRALYAPMHWGLYALLALTAALNAGELLGLLAPGPAWTALLVTLAAASFHAVFHLWRHTTLRDGALRMIFPKAWHPHL